MGVAHFLKILEDAAFDLKHVVQAQLLQVQRCFFTADAAGAIGNHGFVAQLVQVVPRRLRKFAEFGELPIQGADKRTGLNLEGIAGVQRHHRASLVVMPLIQPALDGVGCQGGGATAAGLDGGVVHADDFRFHLHAHALKGLLGGPAFLGGDIGEPGVDTQGLHPGVDGLSGAGQEQVDPFSGQQDCAL